MPAAAAAAQPIDAAPWRERWLGWWALNVTASYAGRTVVETYSRRGTPVDIGPHTTLGVPLPEGRPFAVRATWNGPHQVRIVEPNGVERRLIPGQTTRIQVGEVLLSLHLVRQFWMPRFAGLAWGLSIGWFAVVYVATAGVESIAVGREVGGQYACLYLAKGATYHERVGDWFARVCADPSGGHRGPPDVWTAEYIARLLKEDYTGAEQGVIASNLGEDNPKDADSFYLPAGDAGPGDEMGGAREISNRPVRSYGTGGGDVASAPVEAEAPTSEEGPPIPQQNEVNRQSAEADGTAVEHGDESDDPTAPSAEEKVGWGVRDWYDASDARDDAREISEMLKWSKDRLRIDPDDTGALAVLSYYQYLAQDYGAALDTYDKIIRLEPEVAAGYNNKALIYKRQGAYAEEEALYRVALALDPEDETALNNLAVCLSHQKRFVEATEIMNRLEVLDPGDPYADLHRAKIHAEMGDDARSLEVLEKALSGMAKLDTLHHIEFRQDIRVDPSFGKLREDPRFNAILVRYYGEDTPLPEE